MTNLGCEKMKKKQIKWYKMYWFARDPIIKKRVFWAVRGNHAVSLVSGSIITKQEFFNQKDAPWKIQKW
jgi:hypothetical protein